MEEEKEKNQSSPKTPNPLAIQPSSTGPPLPFGPLALSFPWADPLFPLALTRREAQLPRASAPARVRSPARSRPTDRAAPFVS